MDTILFQKKIKREFNSGRSKEFNIGYKTDKKSKIVIYAVDEGILQLAGYKKPNPLATFFKKYSMQVSSYQSLSLTLPEHEILQKVLGAGGGFGNTASGGAGGGLGGGGTDPPKSVVSKNATYLNIYLTIQVCSKYF